MGEVLAILICVALSCGLVGGLLVVRNQAMLADALSHSVLLGIVLAFFVVKDLDSPLLMLGATVFGVLTVFFIEGLASKVLAHDAATGLVFPLLFALAVILISLFARNVHLDIDMVLMGEVLFAPLNRMDLFGLSLPKALVKSIVVLIGVVSAIGLSFPVLKVYLFDQTQARLAGISRLALEIFLTLLTALTIVNSFDSVGSVSVIALLVGPSMTALLWVKQFKKLMFWTCLVALVEVLVAYAVAMALDFTLAGTCALVCLLGHVVALLLHKNRKSV
ncbi:metal ABC transporter permease [Streptococcus caprae]|uniref:Metal ABC transporter permease n=1 Tax=Streptococcus caprae TaxID=1640501 RepID=A0ABV8CVX9_9STRE